LIRLPWWRLMTKINHESPQYIISSSLLLFPLCKAQIFVLIIVWDIVEKAVSINIGTFAVQEGQVCSSARLSTCKVIKFFIVLISCCRNLINTFERIPPYL
jgi:hypothetical protein